MPSKQVNHVKFEPEILHGNWSPTGNIMKYFVTLPSLVKRTSFLSHTYTMQELVKEVTLKTIVNFFLRGIKLSP